MLPEHVILLSEYSESLAKAETPVLDEKYEELSEALVKKCSILFARNC